VFLDSKISQWTVVNCLPLSFKLHANQRFIVVIGNVPCNPAKNLRAKVSLINVFLCGRSSVINIYIWSIRYWVYTKLKVIAHPNMVTRFDLSGTWHNRHATRPDLLYSGSATSGKNSLRIFECTAVCTNNKIIAWRTFHGKCHNCARFIFLLNCLLSGSPRRTSDTRSSSSRHNASEESRRKLPPLAPQTEETKLAWRW